MVVSKYPVIKNGMNFLVIISDEFPILRYCVDVRKKIKFGLSKSVYKNCYWESNLSDIIKENDSLIKLATVGVEFYIEENKAEFDLIDRIKRQKKTFESWDGIIK